MSSNPSYATEPQVLTTVTLQLRPVMMSRPDLGALQSAKREWISTSSSNVVAERHDHMTLCLRSESLTALGEHGTVLFTWRRTVMSSCLGVRKCLECGNLRPSAEMSCTLQRRKLWVDPDGCICQIRFSSTLPNQGRLVMFGQKQPQRYPHVSKQSTRICHFGWDLNAIRTFQPWFGRYDSRVKCLDTSSLSF
ncbi:hypothetical protein BDV10DRAFT_139979 [Aspergillus recurvatus]